MANAKRSKETLDRGKARLSKKRSYLAKENRLNAKKQRGIVDATQAKRDAALEIALPKILEQKKNIQ